MKPDNKLETTENCPVCGKKGFSLFLKTRDYFLTQEDFTIDKCHSCGFVFTNPIPIASELSRYYDSPNYLSHTANTFSIVGEVYKQFRKVNIKKKYRLVSHMKNGNSILDIGCGTGELLNYFKQNDWDTLGVEPNDSARKIAQQNYQLKVIDEDAINNLKEENFDVISMWHVLEHVPDLNKRMIQLKRLVKKDGIIIIALPNLDSPDAVKYASHWAGLDVPRHLYHFTKDTFQTLLGMHKMKLVDSIPMKFDAYYVSLLSEKYLKRFIPAFPAFFNGFRSNWLAKKGNNYSSMIFVVKPE